MNLLKGFLAALTLTLCIFLASISFGLFASSGSTSRAYATEAISAESSVVSSGVISVEAYQPASEFDQAQPEEVKPALKVTAEIIAYAKTIPAIGKYIQLFTEIFMIVVAILTMIYGFLMGLFKLPFIAATKWGSPEKAAKLEKLWKKIEPITNFIGSVLGPNIKKK